MTVLKTKIFRGSLFRYVLIVFIAIGTAVYCLGYTSMLEFGDPKLRILRYKKILKKNQQSRRALLWRYQNTHNTTTRREILGEACKSLKNDLINEIFPFWYGTKYHFNGTSQNPGSGTIACGYFVATTLRDAGMLIDRVEIARLPSELVLKRICVSGKLRRYYDVSMKDFVKKIKNKNGLFLVGLDTHIGFLVVKDQKVDFIHSTGRFPHHCVIREDALTSKTLINSKCKMVSEISNDLTLAKKWIQRERF